MVYVCGDIELRRSVTRRCSYHWRNGMGETGYLSFPTLHLLRVLRLIQKHPQPELRSRRRARRRADLDV